MGNIVLIKINDKEYAYTRGDNDTIIISSEDVKDLTRNHGESVVALYDDIYYKFGEKGETKGDSYDAVLEKYGEDNVLTLTRPFDSPLWKNYESTVAIKRDDVGEVFHLCKLEKDEKHVPLLTMKRSLFVAPAYYKNKYVSNLFVTKDEEGRHYDLYIENSFYKRYDSLEEITAPIDALVSSDLWVSEAIFEDIRKHIHLAPEDAYFTKAKSEVEYLTKMAHIARDYMKKED